MNADDFEADRWEATVSYDDGRPDDRFTFEEFAELGEMIEAGPDWNEIRVIYLRKRTREAE